MANLKEHLERNLEELDPIWLITAACLSMAAILSWALAALFYSWFGTSTPYVLSLVPSVIFAWLYKKQTKDQRAAIKLVFDLSWNVWTVVTVIFLFRAAASVVNPFAEGKNSNGLSDALNHIEAGWLSIIFGWVYPTAVGRVVISLCDIVWRPAADKDVKQVTENATGAESVALCADSKRINSVAAPTITQEAREKPWNPPV